MTGTVVQLFRRVIELKDGRSYEIPADDAGVPAEDYFGAMGLDELAKFLRNANARVYITPDGPWIARPDLRQLER